MVLLYSIWQWRLWASAYTIPSAVFAGPGHILPRRLGSQHPLLCWLLLFKQSKQDTMQRRQVLPRWLLSTANVQEHKLLPCRFVAGRVPCRHVHCGKRHLHHLRRWDIHQQQWNDSVPAVLIFHALQLLQYMLVYSCLSLACSHSLPAVPPLRPRVAQRQHVPVRTRYALIIVCVLPVQALMWVLNAQVCTSKRPPSWPVSRAAAARWLHHGARPRAPSVCLALSCRQREVYSFFHV